MKIVSVLVKSIFWSWNVLLAALAIFGLAPMVLLPLAVDAFYGLAPWDLVLTTLMLCVIPVVSIVHAKGNEHFAHPRGILSFLFGVELPLLACTFARVFGMGELTGAAAFLYSAIVVGGGVAELRLIVGARLPENQLIDGLCHALMVLRAAAGLYIGALLASLTLPMLGVSLFNVSAQSAEQIMIQIVLLPIMAFFYVSALLVLLLPVGAPIAWIAGIVSSGRTVRQRWGDDDLFVTTVGPVLAAVILTVTMWPQPHKSVLERLQTPPQTDAERVALTTSEDEIALGLVDAYLGKYRYFGDERHRPWSGVLEERSWRAQHRPHDDISDVDDVMREAARPFFFHGDAEWAQGQARDLYRAFFGRELERDHAAAIRTALSSRWSREARFAGFIDEGEARVRLEQQDVDVQHNAGVFTVEVHDTWVNQTTQQQEVVLFFELPESAAVTGLWLGESKDKALAFTHVVSPRGAAQQIYREEVRAKRDPALLEQTGPRQYRLRVFPIPPRTAARSDDIIATATQDGWQDQDTPRVHVWLRYEALPDGAGTPPLPLLRERRNGFWDKRTARHLGDATLSSTDAIAHGSWVQVDADLLEERRQARVSVAGPVFDGCVTLVPQEAPALPSLAGRTVDVVIDRSLSVAPHKERLLRELLLLKARGATLRIVLGTSDLRGEQASIKDDATDDAGLRALVEGLVFFGAAQPKELLGQLLEARAGDVKDAIVVLTGTASYDVADDTPLPLHLLARAAPPVPETPPPPPTPTAPAEDPEHDEDAKNAVPTDASSGTTTTTETTEPVKPAAPPKPATPKLPPTFLVHLSGEMPAGYDDATIDAVRRSGGAAVTELQDGLARMGADAASIWIDGYRVQRTSSPCAAGAGGAVVARQRILAADRGGKAPLETLDALHALAVKASVVTPYSSMIVLVDERQRERLRQLERERERFEREVDDEGKLETEGAKQERVDAKNRQAGEKAAAEKKSIDLLGQAKAPAAPPSTSALATTDATSTPSEVNAKEASQPKDAKPNAAPMLTLSAADEPVAIGEVAVVQNAQPPPPSVVPEVAGTPEPEEWLLFFLCGGVVVWELRRRGMLPVLAFARRK